MNIKKIMQNKLKVTPSKDFDKLFWSRFENEFEKEHKRFSIWTLWGVGGAIAALVVLFVFLPQFASQFHLKETMALTTVEAQEMADSVADAMIDSNSYIVEDLDIEDLLDDESKIADTY